MNLLRFLILFALAVWIGALVFFPVVAQISFSVLPSVHLAGLVVRNSLIALHWTGIAAGGLFLASSLLENRMARGRWAAFRATHLIIVIMLALTAISQFKIIPRMDQLRFAAAKLGSVPAGEALRIEFDSLHAWSRRLEGTVLILGLFVLYLTARRLASFRA